MKSNETLDAYAEELHELFRVGLADLTLTVQHFRRDPSGTKESPDVFVTEFPIRKYGTLYGYSGSGEAAREKGLKSCNETSVS